MRLPIQIHFGYKQPVVTTPKGKVFVAADRGKILPLSLLRKAEIKKSSQQLPEEGEWIEANNLATKPYPQETYLRLYESNATLFRTVNQIAIDVAGLGWKLIPTKEETKGSAREKEIIQNFLDHPNPVTSLRRICQSMIIDWGTTGNYALEVVRNHGSKVAEIYHTPAHTLWAGKSNQDFKARDRYCQIRGMKKTWFKRFGFEGQIDPETGDKKAGLSVDEAGNEMIFVPSFYALNDYYGVPNLLPATGSILMMIGARDYNLSFFVNYGVPAYLVTLSGDWDEDAEEIIGNFLNSEIKGSDNAHKTLILNAPEGGTANFMPLSIKEREGSFRILHQTCREDILAAYSMPPYRVGIIPAGGRLGSGTEARSLTEIYKNSVVEPLQTDLEDIFNLRLFPEGLGCKTWKIEFTDLDLRDQKEEAELYSRLVRQGIMTPNEAREKLDIGKPYSGGDKFYISAGAKEVIPQEGWREEAGGK